MTWTCEQIEARLSDYLDGLLDPVELSTFDTHVISCERCTPLVASVSHLLTNLHAMDDLDTPPRLVYSILDKTLGPRDSLTGWRAAVAWIRNVATPRFAYGAVSLAVTFMTLATASGFSWRKPKLADLTPVNVYRNADRQAHLVYARGTKFVSDLRVVYEIQSRMNNNEPIPATREDTIPQSAPNKDPGRTDNTNPSSPKQQNRANGIGRNLEVLAEELPVLCGAFDARRMP